MMQPNLLDNPRYQELKPYEKLVYGALYGMANKNKQCWIQIETLAKKLGIGQSTVKRALNGDDRKKSKGLYSHGLIKLVSSGKGSERGCNVYEVTKLETMDSKGQAVKGSQRTVIQSPGNFIKSPHGANNTFPKNTFQNTTNGLPAKAGSHWIQSRSIKWDSLIGSLDIPNPAKQDYLSFLNTPNGFIQYDAIDDVVEDIKKFDYQLLDGQVWTDPPIHIVLRDFNKVYLSQGGSGINEELDHHYLAIRELMKKPIEGSQ